MQKKDIKYELISLASKNDGIAALWLYGSRSNGSSNANSDYDLAVLFTNRLNDPLESRLRPELLAIDWVKLLGVKEGMISVVDVQIAPILLAINAISGTLLYCADQNARLMTESVIMSKVELDYLYQQKLEEKKISV